MQRIASMYAPRGLYAQPDRLVDPHRTRTGETRRDEDLGTFGNLVRPGPKLIPQRKPGSRVNDSTPSAASSSQVRVPSPNAGFRWRSASAARYRFSMLSGLASCAATVRSAQCAGCGSHGGCSTDPKSERRLRARPRDRHPAAVPPAHGVARPLPGRVLQDFLGQILDLLQTQLVTLIDVRTARQSQLEQHRRSGPFSTEGDIGIAPAAPCRSPRMTPSRSRPG